jgi:hypothetical protein
VQIARHLEMAVTEEAVLHPLLRGLQLPERVVAAGAGQPRLERLVEAVVQED